MTWRNLTELAEQDDWRELSSALRSGWPADERNDQFDTSLHLAAERGHKDCVETLLEWKADINAPDAEGATPLHRAVRRNQADIVEMLVKAGANLQAETRAGKKPLDEATPGGMIGVYLAHTIARRQQALETALVEEALARVAARQDFTQGLDEPLPVKKPLRIKPGF